MGIKEILITGANSYIGTSFESYLKKWTDRYVVDTLDMENDNWHEKDFSQYDTIFHVAGIAHSDTGKVSEERKAFYYEINSKLTIEVAKKAKAEGVKQFIFMSSAIVYGDCAPIGKRKVITKDTPVSPSNFYGDSKVKAENGIKALSEESFKVVILRPPMIYGKGSKGNYPIMARLAKKISVFPYVKNERSMLYIGNLVEFVRLMVEYEEEGIFWPQNEEYSNTSFMFKEIAATRGKKVVLIKGFGYFLKLMSRFFKIINKVFGNLCYEQSLSEYKENYRLYSLRDSIIETEK